MMVAGKAKLAERRKIADFAMMRASNSQRVVINYVGAIILLVGLATASFVYWHGSPGDPDADDGDPLLSADGSRAYKNALEKNVGAVGLLTAEWSDDLAKLGQPRPLAITILVVSGLAAGGCFLLATRFPH